MARIDDLAPPRRMLEHVAPGCRGNNRMMDEHASSPRGREGARTGNAVKPALEVWEAQIAARFRQSRKGQDTKVVVSRLRSSATLVRRESRRPCGAACYR